MTFPLRWANYSIIFYRDSFLYSPLKYLVLATLSDKMLAGLDVPLFKSGKANPIFTSYKDQASYLMELKENKSKHSVVWLAQSYSSHIKLGHTYDRYSNVTLVHVDDLPSFTKFLSKYVQPSSSKLLAINHSY